MVDIEKYTLKYRAEFADGTKLKTSPILNLLPGVYIVRVPTAELPSEFSDNNGKSIWGYGTLLVFGMIGNYRGFLYITAHGELYIRHTNDKEFHFEWIRVI